MLTTSICDMCHLVARHNIALCILDDLGRRQRRRLWGNCYRVHGAGQFEAWYSRCARALHTATLVKPRKRSPAAQAQRFSQSGAHDARLGELFLGLRRTCMKPISTGATSASPAPPVPRSNRHIAMEHVEALFVAITSTSPVPCPKTYHKITAYKSKVQPQRHAWKLM